MDNENPELYRKMIEEVRDYAIIRIDTDGKVLTWNAGAQVIKGYAPEDIVGRNFRRFYTDMDRQQGKPDELLHQARHTGRATDEGWRVRADGTGFWASVAITALHDDRGEVIGFTKVTRDLTEQKRTDDALKRSEERFARMVAEVADYAILILNPDGIIDTWNTGAERLKGYAPDEIIGQSFTRFYPEQAIAAGQPQQLLAEARHLGRVQDEGWRVRKDGSQFWASVTITALHDEYREIIGFSKVTRDLTERRNAELRLQDMADTLVARNRDLEQFAYLTSHDLQEPLRTVASFARLLESKHGEQLDDDARELLGYMTEASTRMSVMINDLLEHTRIGVESTVEPVDCNPLIDEVLRDLNSAIAQSGAQIRVNELPTVTGNRVNLRLLFQNLISNAIKFVAPDVTPEVHISAQPADSGWTFSVRDNGIGVEPQHADRIFNIFQRLHTREHYSGSGIGLAHCRKIVELHGGNIQLESAPGHGACFRFTIASD